MKHFYRVFDLNLESELDLPNLPSRAGERADLVAVKAGRLIKPQTGLEKFHDWLTESGEVAIEGYRKDDEFLLCFPGAASFLAQKESGRIEVRHVEEIDRMLLAHLLTDQVIPRLLGSLGRIMVHASAVQLASGHTLAFVGKTGDGKSTLAASIVQAGGRVLADDCIELRFVNNGLFAVPAYPSLRLRPDSVEHLGNLEAVGFNTARCGAKQQWTPDSTPDVPSLSKLELLVLLDPVQGQDATVSSSSAKRVTDAMAVIASLFSLDPACPQVLQRNFKLLGALFASDSPVCRLTFPHDHARIPEVHAEIERMLGRIAVSPDEEERSKGR